MYNTRKKNTNGVRCYCAIFGFDVGHYTVGTSHDFHVLHNILVPFSFFSFFFFSWSIKHGRELRSQKECHHISALDAQCNVSKISRGYYTVSAMQVPYRLEPQLQRTNLRGIFPTPSRTRCNSFHRPLPPTEQRLTRK